MPKPEVGPLTGSWKLARLIRSATGIEPTRLIRSPTRIDPMRRRELIIRCGSSVAWPLSARAQQPAMPVIGFLHGGSPDLQGLEEEGRT